MYVQVLLIPGGYFHEVTALTASIAVNSYFRTEHIDTARVPTRGLWFSAGRLSTLLTCVICPVLCTGGRVVRDKALSQPHCIAAAWVEIIAI